MLALEHSRRQQPFAFSCGMDSAFHDPFLNQSMSSYHSFDSTASFGSIPFSFYDSNSLSAEAPSETTNLTMFASQSDHPFHPPSPRPELLPPTLSNASAASIPSNTSSTVGSPHSTHAQAISGHESWSTGNQGLGIGPTIISNDNYDQCFGGVDLDAEMTFNMHGKVADNFVGEYTDISSSQNRTAHSSFSKQPRFSQPSSLPTDVKGSARGGCVTIEPVLQKADRAVTPSLFRSPDTGLSFFTSSNTPTENSQASFQQANAVLQSPAICASSISKTTKFSSPSFSSATSALANAGSSGNPPINTSSFNTAAETSTPTYTGTFQSRFFAQSSGNFMPPIQSSCSFFLESLPHTCYSISLSRRRISFDLFPISVQSWVSVC